MRRVSALVRDTKTISSGAVREAALERLIDSALLGSYTSQHGAFVSSTMVDAELDRAISLRGGQVAYNKWLLETRQTPDDVHILIERDLTIRNARQLVFSGSPTTGEYTRLSQIVVASEFEANELVSLLKNGSEFSKLALTRSTDQGSRLAGGEMGWFYINPIAPGSMAWQEVESAVANLAPEQVIGPIKTSVGFHIVKITARTMRPLAPEDAARLRQAIFARWFADLRKSANIERFP